MTLRSGSNDVRGSGIVLHRGTWLDTNQIQNIRNNYVSKAEQRPSLAPIGRQVIATDVAPSILRPPDGVSATCARPSRCRRMS